MIENLLASIDPATLTGKAIFLAIVICVAMVVQHIVVRLVRRALEVAEVPSVSLFINIVRGVIWSFALLVVLQPVFGIEPTAFVAALGVTSVALSLGLQDTISNLIGGLSLMLTRVVVPGDVITVGSFTGTVTDINWRNTRVIARGGNIEVIPNSVLSKSSFTKLTEGAAAANTFTCVVRSDADPQQVEADLLEIAAKELSGLTISEPEPIVRFGNMDAYGITVSLTTFMVPDTFGTTVNDRIARAVAGKPWLARAV